MLYYNKELFGIPLESDFMINMFYKLILHNNLFN